MWFRRRAPNPPDQTETRSPSPTGAPVAEIPQVDQPDPSLIDPADLIRRITVEQLNETAEQYYARVDDPTPLMTKPFTFLHEAPESLQNLGLLLSGLHLGKTMTVLDYGAGTGWLARFLSQLNCQVIACDVSRTALSIGERLLHELPLIGTAVYRPRFLWTDGHTIDLPDASIDRVICFDAFHHVPNQEEVLSEFARVLRPGGLAGFSEPGRQHSRNPQAQYEMRNHAVLENDVNLPAIFARAQAAGFTSMTIKAVTDLDLSLDDYRVMFEREDKEPLKSELWNQTYNAMFNRSIFFLHKGPLRADSRSHVGLAHRITRCPSHIDARAGVPVRVTVTLQNTGPSHWLHANSEIFGVVRLGSHLYHADGTLIAIDHTRHGLAHDVAPNDSIDVDAELTFPEPGSFRLAFDVVAEGVSWLETLGSKPAIVDVQVSA
jgi:ubiquinone/menaquinone biosynthesis C-methylase UbiE